MEATVPVMHERDHLPSSPHCLDAQPSALIASHGVRHPHALWMLQGPFCVLSVLPRGTPEQPPTFAEPLSSVKVLSSLHMTFPYSCPMMACLAETDPFLPRGVFSFAACQAKTPSGDVAFPCNVFSITTGLTHSHLIRLS